jgi:hypothetical protein
MQVTVRAPKGRIPKEIIVMLVDTGKRLFVNKRPTKDEAGHWSLSFGGKLAIPSVKNCVLVSSDNHTETVLQVRRISQADCEIDSMGVFSPLCAFAFAMAVFLSPI